jgi:hypothetical protein
MFMIKTLALTAMLTTAAALGAQSPDPATCPQHAEHMKASHNAEVDARHDSLVMSHETTHHSFRLFADGGAIELRANDANDQATIDSIRKHLRGIASQFAKADFKTPAFVHGAPPDGVARMERLHRSIDYRYENVAAGARIRMTTSSPEALAAVHEFMKFQVVEHRTANSGSVEKDE